MRIKDIILGKPLKNSELASEKLSKAWGLPVMASDSVSSVAYAGEEILLVLTPVLGMASFRVAPLVTLPILLLLLVLVVSYSQVIDRYPQGGGAYSATKENLGEYPSLVVAASLITDYIMTVAVSLSSAAAAIVSAFPSLLPHKTAIAVLFILIITVGNLRGLRESARIFGIPTYIFIISMGIMIVTGLIRLTSGTIQPITYTPGNPDLVTQNLSASAEGLTLALLLHAYSSGCTALTGVEAVSNAVPSFKEPSQHNAKMVLFMLGAVNIFIFGGTMLLEAHLHVMPLENSTVVSQVAQVVFGGTGFSFMYYVVQLFTALILILAANTAYSGLPVLLYILAHDNYVPRQFAHRGTKLSFSNGIMFICIVAGLLIIGFGADTHKMIPLYTIGVFISFTLCQFGMVQCWRRTKDPGWKYKLFINGFGALMTLISTCVVIYNKFMEGAWVIIASIPILMLLMIYVHRHYTYVGQQLKMDNLSARHDNAPIGSGQCIVLMESINKSLLKSINYAKTISKNTTVLHICSQPEHAAQIRKEWDDLHFSVPLEIVQTPYRDIMQPFDEYIWAREEKLNHGEFITVIIVKFVTDHWYDNLLHSQTTYFFERMLSKHKNVAPVIMPFHYNPDDIKPEIPHPGPEKE